MLDATTLILAGAIFVLAVLYSSVGHAGASAYLAAMALAGIAPPVMKPAALSLNIVVGTIASIRYYRAGHFHWATFWPFAAASIPLAFVGGYIQLPGHLYRTLVGAVLLFAALRIAWSARAGEEQRRAYHPPHILPALLAGAAIGLLAGLTGTGGGIFLSPLLLLFGWAPMRQTAGVTVVFVLANSISGLAGNVTSLGKLPWAIVPWALAAALGGIIGAEFGSRRLAPHVLRLLLAVVLTIAGAKMILT